jgi:hypothetical protein
MLALLEHCPPGYIKSTKLRDLSIPFNSFHGTISSSISSLSSMSVFSIDRNGFSGTILSSLTEMRSLSYISVMYNFFHEPLPSTKFKSNGLKGLALTNNSFSSTISTWFCFSKLWVIHIANNHLTGSLPSCIAGGLYEVSILYLSNNYLNGSISPIFQNPKHWNGLERLTIGFNTFSGSFPTSILTFPKLNFFSAMVNCFSGSLDNSICSTNASFPASNNIKMINLNGLNTAPSCTNHIPYLPSFTNRRMEGTIPDCIWKMKSLQVLYFAGNGFSGTIPSDFNSTSRLNMLSISNNYYTGTIPKTMQENEFLLLDLSYNKFTGNIDFIQNITRASLEGSFNVSNNRLSGQLSNTFHNAHNVEVLFGNMFQCTDNTLPVNDPNYSNYFCGSSSLDNAVYSFAVITLLLMVLLFICFRIFITNNFARDFIVYYKDITSLLLIFWQTLTQKTALNGIANEKKQRISQLFWTFDKIISLARSVGLIYLFCLLPLYPILNTSSVTNRKYQFEYNWIQTASGLTGNIVSVCLFVFWFLILLYFICFVIFNHDLKDQETMISSLKESFVNSKWRKYFARRNSSLGDNLLSLSRESASIDDENSKLEDYPGDVEHLLTANRPSTTGSSDLSESQQLLLSTKLQIPENYESERSFMRNNYQQHFLYSGCYLLLLLSDIVITIIINIYYLLNLDQNSRTKNELLIQFGMALFKLGWNSIFVNGMIGLLKSFTSYALATYHLKIFLLVFNIVLVPCVAAIVYDGSCFDNLFFGTPDLVPIGIYSDLVNTDTEKEIFREDAFQLPWMYYYSCSTKILMSYIPIFFYSYALLPIKIGLEMYFTMNTKIQWIPKQKFIRKAFLGIFRRYDYAKFPKLLAIDSVIASIILHFSVLLTFGLACPLLGVLIVFVIIFECIRWKTLIVQFIFTKSKVPENNLNRRNDHQVENVWLLLYPQHHGIIMKNASEEEKGEVMERLSLVNKSLKDEWFYFYHARWRIVYVSIFFMILILFDFVGDKQGYYLALTLPAVLLFLLLMMRLFLTDILKRVQFLSSTSTASADGVVNLSEEQMRTASGKITRRKSPFRYIFTSLSGNIELEETS